MSWRADDPREYAADHKDYAYIVVSCPHGLFYGTAYTNNDSSWGASGWDVHVYHAGEGRRGGDTEFRRISPDDAWPEGWLWTLEP